jgi:hypothetical protein
MLVRAYNQEATLLTSSTVYVCSRNLKRMHDCRIESSHALLPPAHHASTIAEDRVLCAGRVVCDLDGPGNNTLWILYGRTCHNFVSS